jgi:hypothetical protein
MLRASPQGVKKLGAFPFEALVDSPRNLKIAEEGVFDFLQLLIAEVWK